VEAQSAFAGASRIIVLHAKSLKHPDRTIIHMHRNAEMKFSLRPAQVFSDRWIQFQLVSDLVELLLCHFERVDGFCHYLSCASNFYDLVLT
jgi:hypothetical protein